MDCWSPLPPISVSWDAFGELSVSTTELTCATRHANSLVRSADGAIAWVDAQGVKHWLGNMDIVDCFPGTWTQLSQRSYDTIRSGSNFDCGDAYAGSSVRGPDGAIFKVGTDGVARWAGNGSILGCNGITSWTQVSQAVIDNMTRGANLDCGDAYAGRVIRVGGGFWYVSAAGELYMIPTMGVVACLGSWQWVTAEVRDSIPHSGQVANCSTR